MIRVTIELIPFADESKKKKLGHLEIINDLTHALRPDFGNYSITLMKCGEPPSMNSYQHYHVKDHPRNAGWEKLVRDSFKAFDTQTKEARIEFLEKVAVQAVEHFQIEISEHIEGHVVSPDIDHCVSKGLAPELYAYLKGRGGE